MELVAQPEAAPRSRDSPEWTERCKRQPRLEYQCDNTGPVEQDIALGHLRHHVLVPDVIDYERKGMQ